MGVSLFPRPPGWFPTLGFKPLLVFGGSGRGPLGVVWVPFGSSRMCPPPFFMNPNPPRFSQKAGGGTHRHHLAVGDPRCGCCGSLTVPGRCPSFRAFGEERKEALPSKPSVLSQLDKPLSGGLLDWNWQDGLILLSACLCFPSSFHMCVAAHSQALRKARSNATNSHPCTLLPLCTTARGRGGPVSPGSPGGGTRAEGRARGWPQAPNDFVGSAN